ncbi:hypothetical protein IAQ61_009523 [Plenodomus lingam]|uniref:uncharacterized protein n=1 Tax=Leptosphaeria maculans TaxID=5022 RepID=UPI00332B6036|nr:hypothetical protein IAQ61_009523 [Plenodomus lingam]
MNNKYYAAGSCEYCLRLFFKTSKLIPRAASTQNAAPTQTSGAPSFDTYSDFVTYLAGRKCPGCNTTFLCSSNEVELLFQSWLNKTRELMVIREKDII